MIYVLVHLKRAIKKKEIEFWEERGQCWVKKKKWFLLFCFSTKNLKMGPQLNLITPTRYFSLKKIVQFLCLNWFVSAQTPIYYKTINHTTSNFFSIILLVYSKFEYIRKKNKNLNQPNRARGSGRGTHWMQQQFLLRSWNSMGRITMKRCSFEIYVQLIYSLT